MYLKEPIYLNGSGRKRRISPLRQIANLLFVSLIIGVNYMVFFHDAEVPPAPITDRPTDSEFNPADSLQPTQVPENSVDPDQPSNSPEETTVARSFDGRLKRGDTVFAALAAEGIRETSIAPVLASMKDVFDFRKAQVGHRFRGKMNDNGQILTFEFQTSELDIYHTELVDNSYAAVKKNIPVDRRSVALGCTIGSSLYASLTRCGESPELGARLTELFAFDVDFFQEIRRGDVVRVLIEKVYVNGRFLNYGKVLAAQYDGKFGSHSAYLYRTKNGHQAYYTDSGRALRKEFLKTPLKYTRISSGYTHRRFHPTLHRWKKHLAIDYAAPTNTPVQAVASGTVKHVGLKGASGNLVVIEHPGGYTSYYAHLNKFGRIEPGDSVGQRTVIGYVGKTGRATGPHLHFALKSGRRWVNPLKVKYTTASPIHAGERGQFEGAILPYKQALKKARVLGLAERQG
ncbi:MAG TPA: M23 family metallopeptidase [Myxococcales bacterium]|nr:M23 family metallopeptidase [Myxococcales bacterium]